MFELRNQSKTSLLARITETNHSSKELIKTFEWC